MISTKLAGIGLAAALAGVLPAIPAQAAGLTRTFVSSAGHDSNPCTITLPCSTFAVAYAATAANGIIAALDPGKYGPLNITGPITINGYGWAAITGPAGGSAISINAGDFDAIKLSGLELDGASTATYGVLLSHSGSLIVSNCVIRQFAYGMLLNSSGADVALSDSVIEKNTTYGVLDAPVGGGTAFTFDHVQFTKNETAISIQDSNAPGSTQKASGFDSVISGNTTGVETIGHDGTANPKVTLDNVKVVNNLQTGLSIQEGFLWLSRSTLGGNGTGYDVLNGEIASYGNNQINDQFNNTGSLAPISTR
jgi:hypothetical protein